MSTAGDRQGARRAGALLLACGLGGCLYTHQTEPFDLDLHETPAFDRHAVGEGDVKRFRYSLVDIQWDSAALGEIARAHGIETIFYADLETLSILNGLWSQRTVHVYGR